MSTHTSINLDIAASAGSFSALLRRLVNTILLAALVLAGAATAAAAQSNAKFPADWKSWPVTATGVITGEDTPIPATLPPIVRETLKAYGWVNGKKGSAYEVRVNPKQMASFTKRDGKFADGPTAVLFLTEVNVILVLDHLLGTPEYGVYTADGKDVASSHPTLAPQVCQACHSGYADTCIGGVCSTNRK